MRHLWIIGGGASGVLLAINALRVGDSDLQVEVIDPSPVLGRGVAYGTGADEHLLNVPAGGMSAFPDDPKHFQVWANVDEGEFVPRHRYATYLQEQLAEAIGTSSATFVHRQARATRILSTHGPLSIKLESGELTGADALILATGVEKPLLPDHIQPLVGDGRFIENPWAANATERLAQSSETLIIGSGLTGVDLALTALRRNPQAVVTLVSRNGNLPRAHEHPWRHRIEPPIFTAEQFFAQRDPFGFATESIGEDPRDWRRRLDSLRPNTQQLWIQMSPQMREVFRRDHQHTWDIHRHRMPHSSFELLDTARRDGRLVQLAGEIRGCRVDGEQLEVEVHGRAGTTSVTAELAVLATGPNPDPRSNSLLAHAISEGIVRAGPGGVGLDTELETAKVIDADGTPQSSIYAIGPLRRGSLWESVAIPELREQARSLAHRVLMSAD